MTESPNNPFPTFPPIVTQPEKPEKPGKPGKPSKTTTAAPVFTPPPQTPQVTFPSWNGPVTQAPGSSGGSGNGGSGGSSGSFGGSNFNPGFQVTAPTLVTSKCPKQTLGYWFN